VFSVTADVIPVLPISNFWTTFDSFGVGRACCSHACLVDWTAGDLVSSAAAEISGLNIGFDVHEDFLRLPVPAPTTDELYVFLARCSS
jgi:hypothetical protein